MCIRDRSTWDLQGVCIGLVKTFMSETEKHTLSSCDCHQKAIFCCPQASNGFWFKEKESVQMKEHSNPGLGVKIEIEVDSEMKCTFYFDGVQQFKHELNSDFTPYLYASVYGGYNSEVELIGIV
eukprot:TRINITY_DN26137_c0_g1_i1.p1 TRINITY_DN26137_c0_g1~~TRINITY_DN26137_c0_g1_i1.p1  ORF type:complete len:143 (-),score=31.98 TRINITY_DN26137_c0_g1_i1:105-476(-)